MTWQNRIVGAGTEDPEMLIPHPKNWRKHPKGQAAALEGAIEEIGWIQDIIINQRTGRMIDGHLRAELAIKNKEKTVPVKYVDLSEEEEEKALLTLDPISMMAEADKDRLSALLQNITSDNEKVNQLLEDIGREYKVSTKKAEEDDYEPPAEIETDIVRGDIFQLGRHRVMCGDSTCREDVELLMQGKKADMVFTDPPYGMGKDFENDSGEMRPFHKKWMYQIKSLSKIFLVWYDPKRMSDIIIPGEGAFGKMSDYLHLYKPNDVAFPRHSWIRTSESMIIFGEPKYNEIKPFAHDTYLWNHTGKDKSFYHPSVKPFDVVSDVIHRFKAKLIFDPFLGSGTTLIACEQLDRICFGMEISPQYCEVICQRWEKLTGNKREKVNGVNT